MIEENKRVKQIREALGLTQQKFADNMGFSRAVITNIEYEKTDVKESVRLAICRIYNVNYFWLTEGKGDMFISTPETIIDELIVEYDLDELDKKIIEQYLKLSPKQRDSIKNYIKNIFL